MMKYLFLLPIVFFLPCCNENGHSIKINQKKNSALVKDSLKNSVDLKIKKFNKEEICKKLNAEILSSLKRNDYKKFAAFIHPLKGIRFSVYGYLNTDDKHFNFEDFQKYYPTNVKFTWGYEDGSGEIIVMSIKNFLDKWVFKRNFSESKCTFGYFEKEDTLHGFSTVYGELPFTENYIASSNQFEYPDWNSLKLVFEEYNGMYYLVGVINDEWRI